MLFLTRITMLLIKIIWSVVIVWAFIGVLDFVLEVMRDRYMTFKTNREFKKIVSTS